MGEQRGHKVINNRELDVCAGRAAALHNKRAELLTNNAGLGRPVKDPQFSGPRKLGKLGARPLDPKRHQKLERPVVVVQGNPGEREGLIFLLGTPVVFVLRD